MEIERARHQNAIPPIWERNCPFCPMAVDDELHLLLFCTKNSGIREEFLKRVYEIRPEMATMQYNEKFYSIMSSTDSEILRLLSKFIFNSFKIRKL